MACRLCKERGKTWSGANPVCAFPNGVFTKDNWNCATMNQLREIAREMDNTMRNDMSGGSFGYAPVDDDYAGNEYEGLGGYIALHWYKERGRTSNAVFMSADDETLELTEEVAEIAIATYLAYMNYSRRRSKPVERR